ncbi:putative signaling protein [bioreactor metagenome]|uniref:Putative signaling protein n=1 Tax=bioreactor metagenome TaxID=1076179 RepID=A0A645HL21_9ZZZZ
MNLSVAQLRTPGLVARVAGILERTGIDPAQVELEITESATMREPDYIIRVLSDLKALGVSISIDDFGTGFSSLSYLRRLKVDELKIDKSFVRRMLSSPVD